MNIQAEKLELIRLITEVDSEKVLKKIKSIFSAPNKTETDRILANAAMVQRLEESKQQIKEGNGVKVKLNESY